MTPPTTETGLASNPRDDFIGDVAEAAALEREDARNLVPEFVNTFSLFVDDSSQAMLIDLIPDTLQSRAGNVDDAEQPTLKDLFLALSRREDVTEDRAAVHARAVASAMAKHCDEAELTRFLESLPAEFADLFPSD